MVRRNENGEYVLKSKSVMFSLSRKGKESYIVTCVVSVATQLHFLCRSKPDSMLTSVNI